MNLNCVTVKVGLPTSQLT